MWELDRAREEILYGMNVEVDWVPGTFGNFFVFAVVRGGQGRGKKTEAMFLAAFGLVTRSQSWGWLKFDEFNVRCAT